MKKIDDIVIKDLDDALQNLNRDFDKPVEIGTVFPSIRNHMNDHLKQLCLDKLIKDGYILLSYKHDGYGVDKKKKVDEFYKFYSITYDGLLFIRNGGYRNEQRQKWIKKYLQISNAIVVLLATIFAAWYAVFEIWKYYYGYVPPKV